LEEVAAHLKHRDPHGARSAMEVYVRNSGVRVARILGLENVDEGIL